MLLRPRLLGATILAATLSVAAGSAAFAQSTPTANDARVNATPATNGAPNSVNPVQSGQANSPAAPGQNGNVSDGTGVSEVVITGSRLKRNDLSSAQPIQVIGGQYLDEKGLLNVADAINQLPGVAGSVTPTGDQASYGTGRNFINLFNLGSGRTLTLVNGRRFISDNAAASVGGLAAGNQVDTNAIPTAFIDRIESIQGGGSTVYGSDAISGVINIITRDKFKGLELDAQYGRSDQDDFPEYRARIAAGADFLGGRANLAATFEYQETSSLFQTQRTRLAENYSFATNPANVTATDGIPAQILIAGRTVPEVSNNGVLYRTNSTLLSNLVQVNGGPVQFGPGGILVPYNTGTFYQASVASGGDGLNLASVTALQTPNKRYLAGGLGTFNITDHIRLKGEFTATRVEGTEPANQPIYNSAVFSGTACVVGGACPAAANSGNLAFTTANPFLPAATVAALNAAGLTGNTFYVSRGSQDLVGGANSTDSYTESYRGVLNLEGDFSFWNRNFNWNVFYNYGQAHGEFDNLSISQQRFLYALNAVKDPAGNIVCATPSAAAGGVNAPGFAGCAPLNIFGNNSGSPAAIAYVSQVFTSKFLNEEKNAEANFGGTFWHLPGGDMNFNVGYEYRREEAKFAPDAASAAGIGRSVAIASAKGAFDSREFYAEVNVPIFGPNFNFPLMRAFEFTFSDREVDNSLAGEGRAYSYQGRWYPFHDLLIRATRSRSFRAPAITQLFAPQSSAFSTATDPCDKASITGGARPAIRAANCLKAFQALGLTSTDLSTFSSLVQSRTSPILTGGNLNLKNETAEQYSYGFVYQPHFIPHLAINADLVNIHIGGAISNFTLTSILSTCYDQASQPADVCSRFSRLPNGQIADNAVTGFVNAGFVNFQAMTINISYDFEPHNVKGFEAFPGRIGLNFNAYNNQRYDSSVSGTGLDIVRNSGTIGVPRWTTKFDLSYSNGPFRFIGTERYQSSVRYDNTFTVENRSILTLQDYFLSDLSASYKFRDRYTMRVGIDNLFDVQPPFPSTSTAYDLVGRYYYVGINAKF